jgi:hypothetical protein
MTGEEALGIIDRIKKTTKENSKLANRQAHYKSGQEIPLVGVGYW